jgi:hypothetical protein
MDLNPFAELQQYQLGSSLMGQPQASTPAVQPPVQQLPMAAMPQAAPQGQAPAPQGPPQNPAEYQQRVQGWRATMDELLANPTAAVLLMQMGTSMLSGRGARSMGDAMEAVGRMGTMENQLRRQGVQDSMLERKMGLEERELGAREKLWSSQAANYERLAAGGGRGGGGGGGGQPDTTAMQSDYDECMKLPGATQEICQQAVMKKHYKLGASKYGPFGSGGMSPAEEERYSKRRKELEEIQIFKDLTPEQSKELQDINLKLSGTPWTPTQAQPQMPPTGGAKTAQAPNAKATSPFEPVFAQYATMAEAEAAAAANKIPKNSLVMIGNQRMRWE